jgi:DNA-binding MarR family transcriptional regulator
VYSNGSATYIFRRIFILVTEDDIALFEQYLSGFDTIKENLLGRFINDTRFMVNKASNNTKRSMDAINFNISAYLLQTITGSRGIIEYRFFWVGFAFVDKGQIQIGDVFEVRPFLLEKDELTILYPEGYIVSYVEPDPYSIRNKYRMLIWIGPQSFASGEPAITLTRETGGFFDNLHIGLIISFIALGVVFSTVFYMFRIKKRKQEELRRTSLSILEAESEENKILQLLQESGGYLPQSSIAKKLGLSKSKTSETLKSMEKKGLIRREKKGREKIVILLEQLNDK